MIEPHVTDCQYVLLYLGIGFENCPLAWTTTSPGEKKKMVES